MAVKKTITIPESESGLFKVDLSKSFERNSFTYKPGADLTVKLPLLEEMIAAGVVANVLAAD